MTRSRRPREDEEPSRRRRRDAADDDRSRRSGRSSGRHAKPAGLTIRGKKFAPATLVGLGVAAFALVLTIGIVLYMLVRNSGKPATGDLMAHAPSDALILAGYDFDELSRYDGYRKCLEKRAPPDIVELDRAGLRVADLSRVLMARTVNNGNTCVVRFKTAPEQAKYLQAAGGGKNYSNFTSLTGNYRFGYFADDKTLVLADKEPTIQALREQKKARLPTELREAAERARGPAWRAAGRISMTEFNQLGQADDGFTLRVGPTNGSVAWLVPGGKDGLVHLELDFENANQCTQGAATLKGLFMTQRAVNDFGQLTNRDGVDSGDILDIRRGYEEADISSSGVRVSASLRLPASEALRALGGLRIDRVRQP